MKKKAVIIFLFGLFCCSNFVFAEQQDSNTQEELAKNWSGTKSGDYVIYRDYSWKKETWIGFLYYDKNTVGSFLYTDKGKTFVKILFSGEELDGEFIIIGQNNISGKNNSSDYIYAVNYLMQLLPKLYKWREEPKKESLVLKTCLKHIFEEQYGGECVVNYSSYLPLFYIDSIVDKKEKIVLKIEEMGLVKNSDETFFNFSPIKISKEKKSSFALNTKVKKTIKKIDGITLNLDEQWKQHTQNTFFLKDDLAFLVINAIDLKGIPDAEKDQNAFLIKLLCSSGKDAKVLLNKTDVLGSKDKFKIISSVYDVTTNSVKASIKLIKKYEGLKYQIIILNVDNSIYSHNKEYFDNLF